IRKMAGEINSLRNHVIICGYGRMGRQLAERLVRNKTVAMVIIDAKLDVVNDAIQDGHLAIEGDATSEETLAEAGIDRAATLVVALRSDADNVFLTLTARNMNPHVNIIARGEELATEKKLRQAGANRVILPAVIGAQQIADIILRPHAAHLKYGTGPQAAIDASMEELTIGLSSGLVGKTIRDAETRQKYRVLIVAVRRAEGELIFNPDAAVDFQAGDTLVVIGQAADVKDFTDKYGG
ncbi:MAG: TrkA family potassium uptake protein, partial [Planctomycetales bacterium]|nr:TrkA family potassium uptake protein [Planctomycetales bacterium]